MTLTDRQQAAWPEAIARLRASGAEVPADIRTWSVHYADEVRPGRGHYVNATYLDGETFAQVLMDVYGYPDVSWAALDWVHADANEECRCEMCAAEAHR
jgi:hypothetical protein